MQKPAKGCGAKKWLGDECQCDCVPGKPKGGCPGAQKWNDDTCECNCEKKMPDGGTCDLFDIKFIV